MVLSRHPVSAALFMIVSLVSGCFLFVGSIFFSNFVFSVHGAVMVYSFHYYARTLVLKEKVSHR